ncbi:MAG: ATP--guanido phosphotransferase [Lachnospiraceae bacterium]|nr:ATP--guanido phosphotransferase [Lachnospiraceae bacterium]
MEKWYRIEGKDQDVVVASRVRLSRNIDGRKFPCTLSKEEADQLGKEIEGSLAGLTTITNHKYRTCHLDKMTDTERMTWAERSIINKSLANSERPVSLLVSDDDSISIILNGYDHLRFQVTAPGNNLNAAWSMADKLDDFLNEKYDYAFDERYGYLTSFPTNVGTALKAYMILHLPYLSSHRKFQGLVSQMGRFGLSVKGAIGFEEESCGSLFVVYNQTTLGQTEQETLEKITKISSQLIAQERSLRQQNHELHGDEDRDRAYKTYGILKYARKLSLETAVDYLSVLRTAAFEGEIALENPNRIYEMMITCLPHHMRLRAGADADDSTIETLRAEYVRKNLPELIAGSE